MRGTLLVHTGKTISTGPTETPGSAVTSPATTPILRVTTASRGPGRAAASQASRCGAARITTSTFILPGMAGVELGAHQRFVLRWGFGTTLVMTAVALLTGAVRLP